MSLSLLSSNNREEIKAMQQMYLGRLFTYFQWCWKAEAQRELEEEDKEHRGLKRKEESGGIWPAGVSSVGSPRSSRRAERCNGGKAGGKIGKAQREKLQSPQVRQTQNKKKHSNSKQKEWIGDESCKDDRKETMS